MKSYKTHLNIPKTKRYKTNEDYLKILRLVAEKIEKLSKESGDNDNEL